MLQRMFGLIAMAWLTACAAPSSEPSALPALVDYSAAEQAQAADEIEALPAGSVLERMIGDYAVLRAQVRGGQ